MILTPSILMDAFFIALLLWCSYTDIRKRMVSNVSIILLMFLGVAHTALMALAGNTWWTYPVGMALAVPFFVAWLRDGMGAGDVKLVMGICLYLGALNTLIAFALMVPALFGLMVCAWIKTKTLKSALPFAPVLAFGAGGAVALGYLYALFQI